VILQKFVVEHVRSGNFADKVFPLFGIIRNYLVARFDFEPKSTNLTANIQQGNARAMMIKMTKKTLLPTSLLKRGYALCEAMCDPVSGGPDDISFSLLSLSELRVPGELLESTEPATSIVELSLVDFHFHQGIPTRYLATKTIQVTMYC
jgi:hypothetical protein